MHYMNFNSLVQRIQEGSYYGISTQQQNAGGRQVADNINTANLGLGLTSGSSETNRAYTPSESEEKPKPMSVREVIDGIEHIIERRIESIKQSQPDMTFAIGQLDSLLSDIKSMH
jgi:hypothetical protein